MSLVLAVQPDANQAERLTSVCRRIGADLVLAPSAPEALAALGGRIPDVILSAPLLPASDEAAIAERLRALGNDALHVQAISAPLLGDVAPAEPEPQGLLKAFKRPRRAAAPAVCVEAAFAGELSGHLLRAVAERASMTAEPIEAPVPDVMPSFTSSIEDLWPHVRVTVPTSGVPALAVHGGDDSLGVRFAPRPDATARVHIRDLPPAETTDEGGRLPSSHSGADTTDDQVRLKADTTAETVRLKPDTTGDTIRLKADTTRIPDPGSRIPDPDPPLDIELISLVDAIAEECRPRKRKGQAGRRSRKRRVYDDAAYFDPSRSEFAAVVDKFDEFTRQHSRVA